MKIILSVFILCLWSFVASANEAKIQEGVKSYEEGNYREAFTILHPLAKDGNSEAQYYIGRIYENGGDKISQNKAKAIEWYAKAAKQEHMDAQIAFGKTYFKKYIEPPLVVNEGKVKKELLETEYAGICWTCASEKCGKNYFCPFSFVWVLKSGREFLFLVLVGLASAILINISTGIGGRFIGIESYSLFDKGKKAYDAGYYSEALKIWKSLAERRSVGILGILNPSIKKGSAEAQFEIGKMYEEGIGVFQDYKKAFYWYEKGANQAHAPSQAYLGYLYRHGLGVEEVNEEKAVELYEKAAKQGNAAGQNSLGYMYGKGLGGLKKDPEEAFHWYEKAADQGYAKAQTNIGYVYSKGAGVKQNFKKAIKWYRQSAKQGEVVGQYNLGRMYERGDGFSQSNLHAYKWFYIADKNGDEEAKNKLDEVKKAMKKADRTKGKTKTKKDIAEAIKLAEKCINSNYEDCGDPLEKE